ncbi:MAG: gliding motility lipoprotein GldH [Saprospiraceae bacterium]|nr:gliding motility lipoprotein GldH [Saprospiraceae bacterium]
MLKSLWILFLPALLLLWPSCGKSYFFQEKKEIAQGLWAYGDTAAFRFAIADTSHTYNLYLDFEYADTFATQNIYVRLHTVFPDGKRLSKQRSFDFFDAQGTPQGKCSSHTCTYQILLQENAFFDQPGQYFIGLEQFTRRDPLPGIRALGLTIEDMGAKPK